MISRNPDCDQIVTSKTVMKQIFQTFFTLFQVNPQRQFIIVCGNINFDSVNGFLKDFFHPARDDTNTEVVFLNKNEPDLMFDGLLKREKTRVSYFCVRDVLIKRSVKPSTLCQSYPISYLFWVHCRYTTLCI